MFEKSLHQGDALKQTNESDCSHFKNYSAFCLNVPIGQLLFIHFF